jgi:hypothetical protein
LWYTNPLMTKKEISLRIRNFETNKLKVNDARSNPVEIGAIVVWKVVDSGFGMKWLAENFQKQTITEAFRENIKRITSTNGDVLELAVLDTEETITRFDSKTLFDVVYLGTTESEIRAIACSTATTGAFRRP